MIDILFPDRNSGQDIWSLWSSVANGSLGEKGRSEAIYLVMGVLGPCDYDHVTFTRVYCCLRVEYSEWDLLNFILINFGYNQITKHSFLGNECVPRPIVKSLDTFSSCSQWESHTSINKSSPDHLECYTDILFPLICSHCATQLSLFSKDIPEF